jgi:uncharacterized protein (TIGR03437 family)
MKVPVLLAGLVCASFLSAQIIKIATPPNLPPATVGVPYSLTFQAGVFGAPGGSSLSWDIGTVAPPNGLSLPAGFVVDDPSGRLTGTPTVAGTYMFRVHVDLIYGFQNSIANDMEIVTLTVSQPGSARVTPLNLTFNGFAGGENPPSQALAIVATSGGPSTFTFTVDGGANGSAAPAWLLVGPTQAQSTPGRIIASVDMSKAPANAGTYTGRIRVAIAGSAAPTDVPVTLTLTTSPQVLSVFPTSLRFNKANLQQTVLVRNTGGGGPISIAGGAPGSTFLTGVKFSSPQTPSTVQLTAKVPIPGAYLDTLTVGRSSGPALPGKNSAEIPASFFVPPAGPQLAVDQTGFRFSVRQGLGTSVSQLLRVLNLGDSGSAINWKATVLAGDFLTLSATSGTATPAKPGAITLTIQTAAAAAKDPKGYYALLQIVDTAAPATPQYVVVILDVVSASAPVVPDPTTGGLFFTSVAQGAQTAPQTLTVGASSQTAVPALASASTSDGGTWLSVTPSLSSASSATAASFSVSVGNSLKAGIYRGEIDLAIGTELRAVNVTLIVAPAGTTLPAAPLPSGSSFTSFATPRDATCSPTQLALTETGMVDNFSIPAGWPATLAVQVNDDCGSNVLNGTVVATFSNGDQPITLTGDGFSGKYSATWQPGSVGSPVAITLTAAIAGLPAATTQISGGVNTNATPAPTLVINGLLHNLNPQLGAPLAPGTVAQAYGANLTASADSPSTVPLPTLYKGVQVLMGGLSAPLYYVSPTQLTLQVPSELAAPAEYQALIAVGNAYTLPQPMDLVPLSPGVVAFPDGSLVAQHGDYSLVDATKPAKPGEALVIYLVGMGATSAPVASGTPAPATALISTSTPATVTIDGQAAQVIFSGLTPGGIGLYQINLLVPASAKAGKLPVIIKQGTVSSNQTTLLVQP